MPWDSPRTGTLPSRDAEHNALRSRVCVVERPVAGHTRRDDGARAVGAGAQRAEAVAGPAVDADVEHAGRALGLGYALDRLQHTARRDQEAGAGAADARPRNQVADGLAERSGDGGAVQIDADRGPAQLGVVAAAE